MKQQKPLESIALLSLSHKIDNVTGIRYQINLINNVENGPPSYEIPPGASDRMPQIVFLRSQVAKNSTKQYIKCNVCMKIALNM